jgi:hypothetical protein
MSVMAVLLEHFPMKWTRFIAENAAQEQLEQFPQGWARL